MINYDLTKIKLIAFDVDGVLSTSAMSIGEDGQPMRTVNTKDGYAIQLAIKEGIHIAIITGARCQAIRHRYESLGCTEVYLSVVIR